MEATIDSATQSALAEVLAEEASCWFEDGLSSLDILDCLASAGLGLTPVRELTEPNPLIEVLAEELFDCGHTLDDEEIKDLPAYKQMKREPVLEIADVLDVALDGAELTLIKVEDSSTADAYVIAIADNLAVE